MNGHVYDLLKWSVLAGGNGDGEKINNQDKTITENGIYAADEGYTGLGTVVVNVSSGGEDGADNGLDAFVEMSGTNLISNAEVVGEYALSGLNRPFSIVLPNATAIRRGAFDRSGLTDISMPNVTDIAFEGFDYCRSLVLTSLPSGIENIWSGAFSDCSKLQITSIPSSLKVLSSAAFSWCTGLTTLTFEGVPENVASNVFTGCGNLTTINVPWAEGEVANAPWGATNATINYNYTGA